MKSILYNKIFWIVCGIVMIGFVLRIYHFSDWMHYQLDQSRDFRVIHAALEYGPGELPLQGPRAGGSFLRLGPLLYYLEYGSAIVFGDTPAGSVMIILLLNVLAIPLFYLFVRRFFDQWMSVGLACIFSVSIFLITYSRFGWNPNLILPFTLLFVYALLRLHTYGEKKDHAGWWLVIASVALAFITNMHFVAFVTMPLIAIIYLVWSRPWIGLRYWVVAIGVFLFLNTPLIINDVKTGGENFVAFVDVVLDRSGNASDDDGEAESTKSHTLLDKAVYNFGKHTQFYWMILTGDQMAVIPELDGTDLQCNYDCRHGIVRGVFSMIMIFCAFGCWFFLYYVEEDRAKRDFLRLILVWSGVLFLVYTPLAYDLAPRFFLLNAPIAFVIVGIVFTAISLESRKTGVAMAMIIIVFCVISNLYFLTRYYNELSRAATDPTLVIPHHDRILKEKTRVTYEQMQKITAWMASFGHANGMPVFFDAQLEYKRAFGDLLERENAIQQDGYSSCKAIYAQGNYFVIVRTQSDQSPILSKYTPCLTVEQTNVFGTMTVYYLIQKAEAITDQAKEKFEEDRDPDFAEGVQQRYLWRQVFEE